jgi:hypothetical protein
MRLNAVLELLASDRRDGRAQRPQTGLCEAGHLPDEAKGL